MTGVEMTTKPFLAFLLLTIAAASTVAGELSVEDFIDETGIRAGATPVKERPGWTSTPTILVRTMAGATEGLDDDFPNARIIAVESLDDALLRAPEANVILGFCDSRLIDAAEQLVWVQVYWAGVERCLESEAVGSGRILLTNMQKMSSATIGEHAIAMMLSLTRGLTPYAKMMAEGAWQRDYARNSGMVSVDGKTLLVVGLGGIGRQVAMRGKGLGMRVVATRNSSREGPDYVDYVGLSDELHALAAQADVIVNALPLTPATTGLFDREFFAAAKRGSYFINVGRGSTVVTDDLLLALQDGRLGGAGLDVTEPEPLPADHPLWQLPNVIITPHVAGFGGSRRWHAMLVRENIRRYLAGEALLNVVEPERGY
jgi:phosphoglycerate dehydrogenase-like enzyme